MSTDVENLVSVDEINSAIERFIGQHPENVTIWVDGKTSTIQISNIGLRDKLFYRLAYLVENTTIEDRLKIFNMPAKCVIANERIARFVCTVTELVEYVESQDKADDDETVVAAPSIKKFSNRLTTSHAFKKAETIVNEMKDDSKIKVYIISEPTTHLPGDEEDNVQAYVTWKVLDIIKIDAGTTWGDEAFIERLNELKVSSGAPNHLGSYGAFNIDFFNPNEHSPVQNVKIENGTLVGKLPEFVIKPSVKVGDIIDSRDYQDEDIWGNYGWDYQTNDHDYQMFSAFEGHTLSIDGIECPPYGQTLIPDGAIITI